MAYIKARYLKNGEPHGRSYTFSADFDTAEGDIVLAGKQKVIVVDEPIDEAEIERFGADRIKAVNKCEEESEG